MVNVPTSVWIDEEGTIVRFDEGTYSRKYDLGRFSYGSDDYLPMIRDWVEKGSASRFVQEPNQLADRLDGMDSSEAKADAAFRLGVYFETTGEEERARTYWHQAQTLNPDSWNYHRQEWSYTPSEAGAKWMKKVQTLGDKPYYKPIELPDPPP